MSCDRALVTSRSFGSGEADPAALLRDIQLEVVTGDPGHDRERLAPLLAESTAWVAGAAAIDAELMKLAPRLRVIARVGTGTDAVDLDAAAEHGVVVTNTPGANAASVADLAVGLMLATLRGIVAGDRDVRSGKWRARTPGRELGSLTVGIVGYGAIGRLVSQRVGAGFGARVIVSDPFVDEVQDGELAGLEDLVTGADVVTLHLPSAGVPLVDAGLLARFKPGAILINTARGSLLDEVAVADALHEGRLAAAAVDVLTTEPAVDAPLLSAPNVVVTPHVAATTVQAIDRMGMGAAHEVVRVLGGSPPRHPVRAHR